ncbi:hypothetical protein LSM04_009369 [Trypanosoma melophagium]|uniref:uncharacterized protein n=1 Tax=Trypanosoma melophagium TaxID=715481 RepID=UPI00351A8645|nr:hypothetical protein LSM04_009369 [Trypanosoma melophagium]
MSTDEVHPPDMKGPEEREMSGVEPDDVSTKVTGLHEDGEGAYPAEAKEPGEHEMDNVEPDETAPQATTLREEEVPTEVPEVADTQEQEIAPRDVSDADAVEAFMSTDEVHPPDMKAPEEREMSGVEPDDVSTKVTGLHEDGEGAYPAEAKEPGEHEMDNVEPCDVEAKVAGLHEEGSHTALTASWRMIVPLPATSFSSVPEVEAAEIEEADDDIARQTDRPDPMEDGADEPAEVVDAFGREMDGAEPCDVEAKVAGLHEEGSHTAMWPSAEESLGGQLEDDVAEMATRGLSELSGCGAGAS